MEGVYEGPYRYGECLVFYRNDHDALGWDDLVKLSISVNRPVQYRAENHSIVGDGWKEEWIGDDYYWYHMNYGWPDNNYDTWYALDELPLGGYDEEYMIFGIAPDSALGSSLSGDYAGAPNTWRYLDRDAWGANATFFAGQWLQILRSGFFLGNSGGPSDSLTFYGEPDLHIRFFLYGDPWGKTRILIQGGGMQLHGGGGLAVY